MINKIAVLGCGWLGLPLAKSLLAKSYFINGSTTSAEKLPTILSNGIAPFLVQLGSKLTGDDLQLFLNVDLLIINIPPGRSTNQADDYEAKISALTQEIQKSTIQKVIFISSTSVYPDNQTTVDERCNLINESDAAKRMIKAEEIIKSIPNIQSTVIRMAGLIGPNRHPGRFFAGKENIPAGLSPVNLIHLDDCIGIIETVIDKGLRQAQSDNWEWNQTFNAVAPQHPTRKAYYHKKADILNLPLPTFAENSESKGKIISSKKVETILGYSFQKEI